jgi:hypothetical protein
MSVARHIPRRMGGRPWSAVIPSVQRRRIYTAQSVCGWSALRLRARLPRLYHTSYPVRVPRPARSFHASFRRSLTRTPLRFPCPSAPRTPGQGTYTPEHDSMHGTHAPAELRPTATKGRNDHKGCAVGRPLQWVVRPGPASGALDSGMPRPPIGSPPLPGGAGRGASSSRAPWRS